MSSNTKLINAYGAILISISLLAAFTKWNNKEDIEIKHKLEEKAKTTEQVLPPNLVVPGKVVPSLPLEPPKTGSPP